MNTISLCMIVKNEAENLPRCLHSVAGAVDEIIVVDTGSIDRTIAIAQEFGARVRSFPWNGNFSDARNASLADASGDWILFLDADEELAPESQAVLRRVTAGTTVEGYFIKILNLLGQEQWNETCPDLVFRLFRNRTDYRFRSAIHEQILEVILERNQTARYEIAEDLIIRHYGYLTREVTAKDKKNRNLNLISAEIEKNPQNRLLRYHYGVELYRSERFAEAATELAWAADGIDPRTIYLPKLMRYLVLAYQGAGQHAQALAMVQAGLDLFPDYADLYYYGGLSQLEQKNYALAYQCFQKALATPEQPSYYASFSGSRGFRAYYQLGQLAEAFLNFEEALRYDIRSLADNADFEPALQSIVRLLKPHQDPAYARQCLEKVCDFCTPQAKLWLGRILLQEFGYQLALDYFDEGSAGIETTDQIKLWRAICLCQQQRFLEAIGLLKSFTPDDPLYLLATLNQLLCFWFQGNRRKTRALAKKLFTLNLASDTAAVLKLLLKAEPAKAAEIADAGGRPLFLVWAGRLLKGAASAAQPKKAPPAGKADLGPDGVALFLDIFRRTVALGQLALADALVDQLEPAILSANAAAIGRIFQHYGHLEQACQYYRFHLENQPRSADVLYELAEAERERGNTIRAESLYREALALDPKQPRFYVALIRHYERIRHQLLEEAVGQFPEVTALQKLLQEASSQ